MSRSTMTVEASRLRAIAQATLCATVEAPTPPLAPMTAMMRPRLRVGRRDIELRQRAQHVERAERRDQIFADAAADQVAIELDVVDMADDDDLGAGVAAFRQRIEMADQRRRIGDGFQHDDVGRRRGAEGLDRGGRAAHLDAGMGLVHAPVGDGRLHGGGDARRLAEGLDRDARQRRDDALARGDAGVGAPCVSRRLISGLRRWS